MARKVKNVIFEMLPKAGGMVTFTDQLVLYDNLDRPLSEAFNPEILSFIGGLPKRIDFAIIIVCVKGKVEIDCNLRNLVADPGGMIVLVPGTIGERIDIAPDSTLIAIAVPNQNYAPDPSFQNATYTQKNFTSAFSIQLDDDVLVRGVDSYVQLKNAITTLGDKMNNDLVKAYVTVMAGLAAVNLQKWLISHPEEKTQGREQVLKSFLSDVEEHHRRERSVTFYAGKSGLSPKYFARIIHGVSGKHPLQWIRDYVILDAKSMLKSGDFSITQICEALNFPSQAQFTRYFKNATGLSPVEYAKGRD